MSYRKEEVNLDDRISIEDTTYIVTDEERTDATIILFNKPLGYVVSKSDPHNKTIYDILPEWRENKYYYIWRLDKDSHWLLILTDSSKLVSHFSHPRYMHKKQYIIQTTSALSPADITAGLRGVSYTDADTGETMILDWQSCTPMGNNTYKITLHEWKKRHIRRLCSVLHTHVLDLQRVGFEPWELWNIWLGERFTLSLDWQDLENLLKN